MILILIGVSWPIWGLAMQAMGYGIVMPLWCIVHLSVIKPLVLPRNYTAAVKLRDSNVPALKTMPSAVALGYFLLTFLMVVPLRSNVLHQWFGGLWQGFPLYTFLIHFALEKVQRNFSISSPEKDTSTEANHLLGRVYSLAYASASVSHIITISLILANIFMSGLFPTKLQQSFTIHDVFTPPNPISPPRIKSLACGFHGFLQWDQYVGSTAILLWAAVLWKGTAISPSQNMMKWIHPLVLAGPMGVIITLLRERDKALELSKRKAKEYQR